MSFSLSSFAPENLVSRDKFHSPVPRQPGHLHTRAESGAYLRVSSRVPLRRQFCHTPSSQSRVYWVTHAGSRQGSSEQVLLPWQVTMDKLICASLSHTHYWYEVGMLKVPAVNPSEPGLLAFRQTGLSSKLVPFYNLFILKKKNNV